MTVQQALEESPGKDLVKAWRRLLGHLRTWQNETGLFGGMIATWWSSTLETAAPHPMNQYAALEAFLDLSERGPSAEPWIEEAKRIGEGLLNFRTQDGGFRNAYGDIPGKSDGPVLHAPGITALSRLYRRTGEAAYLDGALGVYRHIRERWAPEGLLFHRVANQQCKWAEALLGLFEATGDSAFREMAAKAFAEALEHQIQEGEMEGAFHQGRLDDRLITVYSAKCLTPLVRWYAATGDERALVSARKLALYLRHCEVSAGIWRAAALPDGRSYRCWRLVAGLDRRLRFAVPIGGWRRRSIRDWVGCESPSFVARSGDGISGLALLGRWDAAAARDAGRLSEKLCTYQLAHGGVRATVGLEGRGESEDVYDFFSVTRWNVAAFRALSNVLDKAPESPLLRAPKPEVLDVLSKCGHARYRENAEVVEVHIAGELAAILEKPSGRCRYLDGRWRGDLTGEQGIGERVAQKRAGARRRRR